MHIDYWMFLLVCIGVYIYSIYEVLHVLLKPKQYKDHPFVFKFCQVDVACVITTIVLIILNYFGKFSDNMAFLIGLCVAYHGLAAIPTVFIDLDRWSDKDIN